MFLLLILIAIFVFIKTPQFKGMLGEFIIGRIIGKTCEESGKEKYVINNLTLQIEEGKTSQIDHIVIIPSGVYVIETKNYSGRIYGNDYQHEWTQVLNYGKIKNHFYSPVKQNFTHIYAIKNLISEEIPVYSLIVFIQSNIQYIKSKFVCTPWNINKKMSENGDTVLTVEQMKTIYETIISNNKTDIFSNIEHISNIKAMKVGIENNICPRCNGELIEKRGKYGKFLACSNYPNCKFTKKLD